MKNFILFLALIAQFLATQACMSKPVGNPRKINIQKHSDPKPLNRKKSWTEICRESKEKNARQFQASLERAVSIPYLNQRLHQHAASTHSPALFVFHFYFAFR